MSISAHTELDFAPYGIDTLWLDRAPRPRTILIAYPHPDDESFGNGGTIARYTAEGVAVHYACATRGECGTVDAPMLAGYASVGELRTAEQACAARALGLAAVHFLGFRDSGMPGSADNQHPNAFIQAPLEQVAGQLTALMRALRPQVVLTFNSYGGYGHPDHIHIHYATRAAFVAAGDPARYPEQIAAGLAPWQPQKLYYPTFSTRFVRLAVGGMRLMGRDPRRFGRNNDIDMVRIIEETTPVTTTVACGAQLEANLQARSCHRSQGGGVPFGGRLPRALLRRIFGSESFTRAIPAWQGGPMEHNLFDG
ncbi:MAG: PIG-L family deacetylase [Kouleothrix sp.]|jgi:mycothiol S-conjugate amidase